MTTVATAPGSPSGGDFAEEQDAPGLNASGLSATPGQKRGREDEAAAGAGEKRWPGWPGDNVFRLIVPVQKVGGIIGRKGEFVKKMCEETRARIKILEGIPGTPERVVMVSAKDEPEAAISPAMDGLLKVHKRVIESIDIDGDRTSSGLVSSRLLVAATQAGSLIGRQGITIKSIQDASGASVRVISVDELPLCALPDDRVVEIQGEGSKVQKAMELIVSHLRKFLVDRSILPLFELNRESVQQQTQTCSYSDAIRRAHMDTELSTNAVGDPPLPLVLWDDDNGRMERVEFGLFSQPTVALRHRLAHQRGVQNQSQQVPPHTSWGPSSGAGLPPPTGAGLGTAASSHYTGPSYQHDSYYQPSDTFDPPNHHHGVTIFGRDPGAGGLNMQVAPPLPAPVITQVTQKMQIPLSYADAIIGSAGANISHMRRTSGATITIQETRGVHGEMTVEIHGTATQVQTAQQLIQNYMAGAPTPVSSYNSIEPPYSSYSSQGLYSSATGGPTSLSTGMYGSPYGGNYTY